MQRSLSAAAPTANKERKGKVGPSRAPFFCVAFIKRDCCIVKLVNVFFLGNHCSVMMNERRKKLLISKKERPFHGALLMEVHQQERNTELSNGACTTTRLMQSSVYIFPFIFGPTRSVGQEEHLRQELVPLSRDDVCWYGRLINLSLSCCSLSPFGSSACVHYTARCARVFITPRLLLLQQLLCVSLYIYTETHPAYHRYTHSLYTLCIYDRPCFCMSCCYTDPFTFDCSPRSGARKTWLYHQIKTEGATSQTRPTQTNQHLIISSVSSLYVHNISPSSILVCRHGGVSILTQSLSSKSQLFLLFLRYILVSTIIISNDVAVDQPGMDVHRLYETAIFVSCWASGSPGQVVITESSTFPIR